MFPELHVLLIPHRIKWTVPKLCSFGKCVEIKAFTDGFGAMLLRVISISSKISIKEHRSGVSSLNGIEKNSKTGTKEHRSDPVN